MLDLALVGFRHEKNFKVFKIDQGNTSPENLGNKFAMSLSRNSGSLSTKNSQGYFNEIFVINDENESSYISRYLPRNMEMIANQDFSFIVFNSGSRRYRNYGNIVIPDDSDQIEPSNLQKYKWAYIYNFLDNKIEFYGKDFPIKEELESPIDMPYYAGINVNLASMITGFQRYFDITQLLPRNHEQEIMLKKSLGKIKPHKHKSGRKKPETRSY